MTKGCWQLYEVALAHEEPLIPPTTFEGAVASWRLLTEWLSRQPQWTLLQKSVGAENAYSTYRTPQGALYGLWVKESTLTELPPVLPTMGMEWLARTVDVIEPVNVSGNSENTNEPDIDVTPTIELRIADEFASEREAFGGESEVARTS